MAENKICIKNCVVHRMFFNFLFSPIGLLDGNVFALQKRNIQKTLLFEPAWPASESSIEALVMGYNLGGWGHMDHYQMFTRPGSWPDLVLVKIWLTSKDIANWVQAWVYRQNTIVHCSGISMLIQIFFLMFENGLTVQKLHSRGLCKLCRVVAG